MLKLHLSSIIHANKSPFVEKRIITDNDIVAIEAFILSNNVI